MIGIKVKLSPNSRFWGENSETNPTETEGTVISISLEETEILPIRVGWCNGCINVYAKEDLIFLSEYTLYEDVIL